MADLLLAKRSLPVKDTGGHKIKSVIIPARRVKLIKRLKFKPNSRGRPRQLSQKRVVTNRPYPTITPEQRRKEIAQIAEESDNDDLVVSEEVNLDTIGEKISNERGRLLRQSTLKPVAVEPKPIREPDPILVNSVDTTKRIVRVVNRPLQTPTLDIEVVPKTRSIGVQVCTPSLEIDNRQGVAPIVAPAPEPPHKSYWTHKVNLPYPPVQEPQMVVNATYMQQQSPPVQYLQQHPYYQPLPYTLQPFIQEVGPFTPVPFGYQPQPSRRQKRNFNKSQKYLQRKQI